MRLLILACFVFILGCQRSQFEGYSITKNNLHYKLHFIGDGEKTPQIGDYLSYALVLSTLNDSVFYTNQNSAAGGEKIQMFNYSVKGAVQEALSLMQSGDSLTLIIEREKLLLEPFQFAKNLPNHHQYFKAQLKLNTLFSPEEFTQFQTQKKWQQDDEMNEQIALKKFLNDHEIGQENYLNGIYFIEHQPGKGPLPESGNSVLIHYKAGFLDGRRLDDTYFLNKPLEVRLGDPDQLLPGFELGIRQMRKGAHATFIIPSLLAFGENGSTNGSVKPFETLLYEVELIAIF